MSHIPIRASHTCVITGSPTQLETAQPRGCWATAQPKLSESCVGTLRNDGSRLMELAPYVSPDEALARVAVGSLAESSSYC